MQHTTSKENGTHDEAREKPDLTGFVADVESGV
jgi:hypothetical protein